MTPGNPTDIAHKIADIIHVLLSKLSVEGQRKARMNLRGRIQNFNLEEMRSKKSPGGASIGTSISILKNILNGNDPIFIRAVIMELSKIL